LLLNSALQPPAQEALDGQPLKLRDAIGRTSDARQMLSTVKTYWQLSHAMCQYHYCLEEEQFLGNLRVPAQSTDQVLLTAAQRAHSANVLQARLLVATEQYELTDQAGVPVDPPPLAADSPWVGKYRTNFETLFAGRPIPAGMRRIDATLPQFLQLIDARADAVLAATDALLAQSEAYAQSRASLSDVLECHARLRLARLEFLMSVRDYNQSIADYAIQAVGSGLSPDTVITMLIQPVSREKSVLVSPPSDIQPATAIEAAR
jgi:hypothetical protein